MSSEQRLTQQYCDRFEALFRVIGIEALERIFTRIKWPKVNANEGPYWNQLIRAECKHAFEVALQKNCELLLRAGENEVHIRTAKLTAKQVLERAHERAMIEHQQAVSESKRLIKETRSQLAQNLKKTHSRLNSLRASAQALERRLGAMGDVIKARKALAEQITRARHKLRGLRDLGIQEETALMVKTQANLTPTALSLIYPEVPPPKHTPSNLGIGLPQESGIYFLWKDGVVQYVGRSINLNTRVRLNSHHVLTQEHLISFVMMETRDLTWAECWYIGMLRPQRNFGKHAYHYDEKSDSQPIEEPA